MSASMSTFNLTGVKRAVIVGITYFDQGNALRGPVNDIKLIYKYLTTICGFDPKNIAICTDADTGIQNSTNLPGTKEYILTALRMLVKVAKPGDSLWFSYSGHGGKVWDVSGDEEDGFDNTILPSDHATKGAIIDDEMHEIVKGVCAGARLTALFDCCRGGTILDLQFRYKVTGHDIIMRETNKGNGPSKLKIARAMMADSVTGAIHGAKNGRKKNGLKGALFGAVKGGAGGVSGDIGSGIAAMRYIVSGEGQERAETVSERINCEILCFSGSKDYMPTQEAFNQELGVPCGQLTLSFLKAVEGGSYRTYREVLHLLREQLKPVMFMKPQFSTSHEFNVDNPFSL